MQVDDALGTLPNHVAQIGPAIFVVDVVVQNVLADVLFAGVVESLEHGVQGTFKRGRVGLEVRFDHVNAGEKSRVGAFAERHHEPLDAVADGHAANQAVVQRIEVVEEVALRLGVLGVFPAQKLGNVGAWIGIHQLVLLGHELHFFVGNLLLNLRPERAVFELLAQASDLVVVDPAEVLVSEPRLVFSTCGSRFATGHLLGAEHEAQIGFVGIHHELAVVLGVGAGQLVEAPVHVHLAKIKRFVSDFGTVHEGEVAPFRFVEVQDGAVGRRHGSVKVHLAFFVARVGVIDTAFPFGGHRHIGLCGCVLSGLGGFRSGRFCRFG